MPKQEKQTKLICGGCGGAGYVQFTDNKTRKTTNVICNICKGSGRV